MQKETTSQRVLFDDMSQTQTTTVAQPYDEKEKGKAVRRKDRSKLQTTTAHYCQVQPSTPQYSPLHPSVAQ